VNCNCPCVDSDDCSADNCCSVFEGECCQPYGTVGTLGGSCRTGYASCFASCDYPGTPSATLSCGTTNGIPGYDFIDVFVPHCGVRPSCSACKGTLYYFERNQCP